MLLCWARQSPFSESLQRMHPAKFPANLELHRTVLMTGGRGQRAHGAIAIERVGWMTVSPFFTTRLLHSGIYRQMTAVSPGHGMVWEINRVPVRPDIIQNTGRVPELGLLCGPKVPLYEVIELQVIAFPHHHYAPGSNSRRSSNRFAVSSPEKKLMPVTLPPGRHPRPGVQASSDRG